LHSVAQCLFGYGTIVVILLVLLSWLRKRSRHSGMTLTPAQRSILLVCIASSFPLILLQLSGINHLLRYLTPTVFATALAIGLLAHLAGCLRSRAFVLVSTVAVALQFSLIAYPVFFPNTAEIVDAPTNGFPPWRVMA